MRAETIAEIKASARSQLLEHGPSGISLRAIARDVGVTPAALYRYFDNLDALLLELCCDLYDELIAETREAMDASPADAHLERMKAWVWAFRGWAVRNRREFELMISYPEERAAMSVCLTSDSTPETMSPVAMKSLEHSRQCGLELAGFYRKSLAEGGPTAAPVPAPDLSEGLRREMVEQCSLFITGEELPLDWIYSFISAWVRVFGLVVMEVFGNLPVQDHIDEFYKSQIMAMLRDFGIEV
jgi:AcrR family transcriptional regulator